MSTFTLVSFHAHPDDESLLTGGTLARSSAEGHRVVLVVATDGELGLAGAADGTGPDLARRRRRELDRAAACLGVHRVVWLGYGDSGLRPDPGNPALFANTDPQEAADRLAGVLREERADVLTVYDPNGGYGHPDHVQVHRVGTRAASLAGTPVVLEATVPAGAFRTVIGVLRRAGHALGSPLPFEDRPVFSPRGRITHAVRVDAHLRAKRAAMASHASQRRADGQGRVLDHLLRLPVPLFALVFGREWFVEQQRPAGRRESDVFATLRTGGHRSVA